MTMNLSIEAKKDIARLLIETEAFDLFMQKRFNQVKRYGLGDVNLLLLLLISF
jgi:hypothetical protein